MKFFIFLGFCAIQILFVTSKIIPDHLPQPCSKSVQDYSDCTFKVFQKMGPHLLKGIREINFPKMNPLTIPLFIVNRTIDEFVIVDAVLRNVQIRGYDTATIKSFKFDTENMKGELHLHLESMRASMDYDITGRLLAVNLNGTGFSKGNFTNLDLVFKFTLKEVDKLGVKYYAYEDFTAKGTVGDGSMKLIAKDPEGQSAADFLSNFFNDNPKRTFAAIGPIFDESIGEFHKFLSEQVLNTVPARELIPE